MPFLCAATTRPHGELVHGLCLTPMWQSKRIAVMMASLRVPLRRAIGRVPGQEYEVVNHAARDRGCGTFWCEKTALLAAYGQQVLPL